MKHEIANRIRGLPKDLRAQLEFAVWRIGGDLVYASFGDKGEGDRDGLRETIVENARLIMDETLCYAMFFRSGLARDPDARYMEIDGLPLWMKVTRTCGLQVECA